MKFEQYYTEGQQFVKEIAAELGAADQPDQAARIMTAVLHTIREVITPEESLHLISQLPMLIKGIYVNGWTLKNKSRIKTLDDFIECLMLQNPKATPDDFGNDEKAIAVIKAVIRVLRKRVSTGEVKDIVSQLPDELTQLWLNEIEEAEWHSHLKS
jgi:uncharacterized protein (DUF2267 family)